MYLPNFLYYMTINNSRAFLLLFLMIRTVPTNPNKMKMESTMGMIIL